MPNRFNEIGRFFEDRPYISLFPKLGWDTAVDVFEEGGNVVAEMNIPGIDADDLDILVEEDELTISGAREEEEETEGKEYYSKEIRRGAFSRTVSLPKAVEALKTKAEYKDGVLTVTMPAVKGKEKTSVKVEVVK